MIKIKKTAIIGLIPLVTLLTMLQVAFAATTLTVNTTADVQADDGLCSLREAVQVALTNTDSGITPGECLTGTGSPYNITLPSGTFHLASAINIHNTIGSLSITGQGELNTIITGDDVTQIFIIADSANVSINSLSLTHGFASGIGNNGGAVQILYPTSTLTLTDVTVSFSNTGAGSSGGGAISNNGNLSLDSCTLTDNASMTDGGGIRNSGVLQVANSVLKDNVAASNGGGISNVLGSVINMSSSIISGNQSSDKGGGIDITESSGTITSTSFIENSTTNSGGGIMINQNDAPIVITDSSFIKNSSNVSGGGIAITARNAQIDIVKTTVNSNTASYGAGILTSGGASTAINITNSTIANNTSDCPIVTCGAHPGTGIVSGSTGGTINITNSTLSENQHLGIIDNIARNGAETVSVQNTIVSDTTGTGFGNCTGSVIDSGNNLEYPGTNCGFTVNALHQDPQLQALSNNGGTTLTMAIPTTSPAKDAGATIGTITTDQRGIARPKGAAYDIGAYEYDPGATVIDISVSKTTSPVFTAGDPVSYSILVNNNDPAQSITGISVVDILPAVITNATWSCSITTGTGTCPPAGTGDVNTTLDLNASSSATFTINATLSLSAGGTVQNTASVGLPLGYVDSNVLNNSSTTATPVNSGVLTINTNTLPHGSTLHAYAQTLSASGGVAPYTWSIAMGTLPDGLALNASTGVIDGTPSTAHESSMVFRVTDSLSTTVDSSSITITIDESPWINPLQVLPHADLGIAYNYTLDYDFGTPPYTWNLLTGPGSLPPGLTLNTSTGIISGTPTTGGTYSFDLSLTDSATSPITSPTVTLTINAGPSISVIGSNQNALVGVNYTLTPIVTGGTAPYTWTLVSGNPSLPNGMTFNPADGSVSGAPTTGGTYPYTIMVTDANGDSSSHYNVTINVDAIPILTINTPTFPTGVEGSPYSVTMTATNTGTHPYNWTTTGTLPPGLTINNSTGVISGTPTTAGNYSFNVWLFDDGTPSHMAMPLSSSISIVSASGVYITTSSLPNADVGATYSDTVQATGGTTPYTFTVTSGTLPSGVTLNSSTGELTGTPTNSDNYTFDLTVTDSTTPVAQTFVQHFSMVVRPVISTASLPLGTAGAVYAPQTLTATGATSYTNWQVASGSLPAGLTLHAATGIIDGTVGLLAVTSTFGITTDDNNGITSPLKSFTITIPGSLTISSVSPLTEGVAGTAYTSTLGVTGGVAPYTWSVSSGSLPSGLTLNTSTGNISGMPSTSGTSTFDVMVTDNVPVNTTKTFTLTIVPAISTSTLPAGTVASLYSQTLTATGGASYSNWLVSSGALPTGLTLNSATGLISGNPTTAGTYNFAVTVEDNNALTSPAKNLSITINPIVGGGGGGGGGGGSIQLPLQQVPQPQSQQVEVPQEVTAPFFNDTSGHWADQFINKLHEGCEINGYLDANGNPLHLFRPDLQITRGELITMVIKCKMGTSLPQASKSSYKDVKITDPLAPYIEKATELGIVKGYSDGSFKQHQIAKRSESLKMILLGWYSQDEIDKAVPTTVCKDVDQSQFYAPYFNFALEKKIINGYKDQQGNLLGICRPELSITRAETATVIVKAK